MVLRLRHDGRDAGRLRPHRPLPEPGAVLVLGLPGGRGPAAGDRGRPRRAAPPAAVARAARRGPVGRPHVEVPFDHMTLGCEAFALGLDDPAETYAPAGGERVPFGLDLEWDTDGVAYAYPPARPATRCRAGCTARCWWATSGSPSTASASATTRGATATGGPSAGRGPRAGSTTAPASTALRLRLGDDALPYHPGYVQPPGGPLAEVAHTATSADLGRGPAGVRPG